MDLLQNYSDSEDEGGNEQQEGAVAGAAASPAAPANNKSNGASPTNAKTAPAPPVAAPIVLPPPVFDTDEDMQTTYHVSGARKRDIGHVSGSSLVTSPRARPSSRPNNGQGSGVDTASPGARAVPAGVVAAGVHVPASLIPPQARGRANVSVAEEVELTAAQRAAATKRKQQQQQQA